jgi:hypothetical protein
LTQRQAKWFPIPSTVPRYQFPVEMFLALLTAFVLVTPVAGGLGAASA